MPETMIPEAEVKTILGDILDHRGAYYAAARDLPEGWSVALLDPLDTLKPFPRLRLRSGYTLAMYQFKMGGNGKGMMLAIPEGETLPAPTFRKRWLFFVASEPTSPEWADRKVSAYIEGDGTPESFFQASLCVRELAEIGAMWHGCRWSTHKVLVAERDLSELLSDKNAPGMSGQLTWSSDKPACWLPRVTVDEHATTVEFLTYSAFGQQAVYRYADRFENEYAFTSESVVLASGPAGYIF